MPPSLPDIHADGYMGAVTWKDLTIVLDMEGNIFYHKDGKWHLKLTSGEIPQHRDGAGIAVHNDTVYMICGETNFWEEHLYQHLYNDIHALDLNSWKWTKLTPTGLQPKKSSYMSAWIHNGKVYCFGGRLLDVGQAQTCSNQLFCYNISSNSWELPSTRGKSPSPRSQHTTFISGNTAFLFGGKEAHGLKNDLFTLDMVTMTWTEVHPQLEHLGELVPERRQLHSMTLISSEVAILLGGYGPFGQTDCWILDTAKALRGDFAGPPSIWKRQKKTIIGRADHYAVIEPVSKRLWILETYPNTIASITLNSGASLKFLAMEKALSFLSPGHPMLEASELPRHLKLEIENHFH